MTIKVVGRIDTKYRQNCTDKSCGAILEFHHSDVKFNSTYSMGREVNRIQGIVCPECNQVLNIKNATALN
jgi:hypothetical protein